jgi:hypothetical protein
MKKVKFIKDFVHGNKNVDKKGKTKTVTSMHAAFLEKNKFAVIVDKDEKDDKEAEGREKK